MTFTDTRARIAAALSTVPGVTGYAFRPNVITAGDAWVLLSVAERGPGTAWSATWRCVVILGGDEQAAQTLLDAVLPTLVDELDPVAYVDQAAPVAVATNAGDMYGVELQVRSE